MNGGSLAAYYFHQGTNYYSYDYLGVQRRKINGKYEYTFRTWAPNAHSVSLVSDFVGWDSPLPMTKITDKGIYELVYSSSVPLEGEPYKYRITSDAGVHDKGDPYALFSRGKDDGASIIYDRRAFRFTDGRWLAARKKKMSVKEGSYLPTPINIYEMHLGSFMRHEDDNSYVTYLELCDILPSYLKKMGYTHVEFLPLQEHPYDGSWGYQVCGFYAVSSRFGTPDDFKKLVNALHNAGIGVIMDWVPAHFPKDEWGLYEFDGKPLYEYQGKDKQESRSWGTRFFDLGREEIQSFLISNALYFLRELHVDGLRVDAVASMIYLDYDRLPGEWVPAYDGTNENKEAIAFIKKLNSAVLGEFPDALMIAEESTAFGGVTAPVGAGGMGFSLKWNMGWANDFYDYLSTDPLFRQYKHTALNFPLMYAFSENYVMPISHDEVVHGKKSFVDKFSGEYGDKFLGARVGLLLQMTYPGKKLLFMGTEYAQFREWDFDNSLEWFMLDYPNHKYFRDYVSSLNAFYLERRELWERDFTPEGFSWLLADEAEKNLVAFRRHSLDGRSIIVILNFSGVTQGGSFEVGSRESFTPIFDTGNLSESDRSVSLSKDGERTLLNFCVPRLSGLVLECKVNRHRPSAKRAAAGKQ